MKTLNRCITNSKQAQLLTFATTFGLAPDVGDIIHVKQCSKVDQRQRSNSIQILTAQSFDVSYPEIIASCYYVLQCIHHSHNINTQPYQHKCTKHQFIHLLTATFKNLHVENSKNYKRWYCPHHTDWVSIIVLKGNHVKHVM